MTDSAIWETYKALNKMNAKKRARNKTHSAEILKRQGIEFVEKNNGAHLIVNGKDCLIDFWPGTGRFITREGTKGRGVFNLIKHCRRRKNE